MSKPCIFREIKEMEYIIKHMFDDNPYKAMKHFRQGLAGAKSRNNKKIEEIFKSNIKTIETIIYKREN